VVCDRVDLFSLTAHKTGGDCHKPQAMSFQQALPSSSRLEGVVLKASDSGICSDSYFWIIVGQAKVWPRGDVIFTCQS